MLSSKIWIDVDFEALSVPYAPNERVACIGGPIAGDA
jgi:hypothetical protein